MSGALPRAAVFRILKKSTGLRVEKDAVIELKAFLEEVGEETTRRAANLAAFAKRKTLTKEDISLGATQ
jgi:histone H3/H4